MLWSVRVNTAATIHSSWSTGRAQVVRKLTETEEDSSAADVKDGSRWRKKEKKEKKWKKRKERKIARLRFVCQPASTLRGPYLVFRTRVYRAKEGTHTYTHARAKRAKRRFQFNIRPTTFPPRRTLVQKRRRRSFILRGGFFFLFFTPFSRSRSVLCPRGTYSRDSQFVGHPTDSSFDFGEKQKNQEGFYVPPRPHRDVVQIFTYEFFPGCIRVQRPKTTV